MRRAHLTHIVHEGPTTWRVECDCGWFTYKKLRREAIAEGEHHWLISPLETETDDKDAR